MKKVGEPAEPADTAGGARERGGRLVQTLLSPATLERVKALAARDGRSVAAWLRRLIERELELVDRALERFR